MPRPRPLAPDRQNPSAPEPAIGADEAVEEPRTLDAAVLEHLTREQRDEFSREIEKLPRLLDDGELPHLLASADHSGTHGLLAVTPKRLFYVRVPTEPYGDWDRPSFALPEIDSVDGDSACA